MWWKTHAAAGAAGSLFYLGTLAGKAPFLPKTELDTIAFVGISVIAAVAVDIDSTKSKVGRLLLPVSFVTETVIGHRGLLHWPVVPFLLYLVMVLIMPLFGKPIGPIIAMPILIGYVFGHLVLDLFNKAGLPLWPFKGRLSLASITPVGLIDKLICLCLDICVCLMVVQSIMGSSWIHLTLIPVRIPAIF